MKKLLLYSLLLTGLTACKFGRFVIYNFADINDYKKFPERELVKSDQPFDFFRAAEEKIPKTIGINGEDKNFEDFLEEHKTVSFLIIRNDSLLYENYFNDYKKESITTSFSMAKSVTSILIGFAIQEGFIGSVEEPVTNYLPELKENGFDKVKILHLLQMTSGMKFNESYINPFGDAATYYYGRNLRTTISKATLDEKPGEKFDYQSGSTQLLGLILERALKDRTVTSYLQEKIWQPLGMQYNGSWSIDKKKNGLEKTFCCINARAIDFAKIGRFYLNKGEWNGKQLLNKEWIEESTKRDNSEGAWNGYQYQWWISGNKGAFLAIGILGQYIYVNPNKNLIMVRMGKKGGGVDWQGLFSSLDNLY